MTKGFASTTDMTEKKVTFSEIGTDLYAFHGRRRSELGGHRRR